MSTLQEAIENRDQYLKEHPELEGYQKEIDDILSKTPEEYKFSVISLMLSNKLNELVSKLNELENIIK